MADSEYIPIFRLYIEFESDHDWNEMREILEEWEQGGIAKIDSARNIEHWYDGADSPFSTKIDHESRRR